MGGGYSQSNGFLMSLFKIESAGFDTSDASTVGDADTLGTMKEIRLRYGTDANADYLEADERFYQYFYHMHLEGTTIYSVTRGARLE
jgi:hypothetical protein